MSLQTQRPVRIVFPWANPATRWLLIGALLVCLIALGCWPMARAGRAEATPPVDNATCLECHGENLDTAAMGKGVHTKVNCQSCHQGLGEYPHDEKALAQRATCTTCHTKEAKALKGSTHHAGTKQKPAPTCQTCHPGTAHTLTALPKAAATQDATCKQCHGAAMKQVAGSVHGVAGLHGASRATCRSCHGTDPHAVPSAKVATTQASCRTCHTDVTQDLHGSVHAQAKLDCATCHGGTAHTVRPAPAAAAKSDTTCRSCHSKVATAMTRNAHGAGSCRDCHDNNAHAIAKPQAKTAQETSAKCASCHTEVAHGMAASVHGKSALTNAKAPNCASCHGANMHAVTSAKTMATQPRDGTCRSCHKPQAAALQDSVHKNAFLMGDKPASCFACHGTSPHTIRKINAGTSAQIVQTCKSCHADKVALHGTSKHDLLDKEPGDHPTCLSCHGKDVHRVKHRQPLSPTQQVALCSKCHSDTAKMARYGMTTEAVSSYRQSFHGRAVVKYGIKGTATCTECHGLHAVMAPAAAQSPVNKNNVAHTCSRCHKGAKLNFAMSGANHLRLKIDRHPILRLEELAFRGLIFGTMAFLFGMVLLDIRRKLFDPDFLPQCGRFVTTLIAGGLLALVGGIIFSFLRWPYAAWFWVASGVLAVVAYILNRIRLKRQPPQHGKLYPRFNGVQRAQHFLLALSFTLLVLTGFPLHFAYVDWAQYLLLPFGGLEGARIIHRIAGVLMVTNFMWHVAYLLLRWKQANFSLKSWTMFPSWKDAVDMFHYFQWLLGLRKKLPEWDRFQFREKFDYYADIWGTFVMGATGVLLWFPVVLGNHLPNWAFGAAYIAHSYEGTLALMAILVWHFYNTHFNPDNFPMNAAWLTGTLSEEEMEREHPLEKARLDAAATPAETPAGDIS